MINPNTVRMLDQEAYDRAIAAQKVHDRNAVLEDENETLRARVAELTGRVIGLTGVYEAALCWYDAEEEELRTFGGTLEQRLEVVDRRDEAKTALFVSLDRARAALGEG